MADARRRGRVTRASAPPRSPHPQSTKLKAHAQSPGHTLYNGFTLLKLRTAPQAEIAECSRLHRTRKFCPRADTFYNGFGYYMWYKKTAGAAAYTALR